MDPDHVSGLGAEASPAQCTTLTQHLLASAILQRVGILPCIVGPVAVLAGDLFVAHLRILGLDMKDPMCGRIATQRAGSPGRDQVNQLALLPSSVLPKLLLRCETPAVLTTLADPHFTLSSASQWRESPAPTKAMACET